MAELTEPIIVQLASAISVDKMEKIALGHLGISNPVVKNIRTDEKNADAISREMIRTWAYRNPDNQIKV